MKRTFLFFLILSLVFTCACSAALEEPETEVTETVEAPSSVVPKTEETPLLDVSEIEGYLCNQKWDGKTLRVLCVGNSFSRNATRVLYQIAKKEGVEEIVLGILRIGGGTVKQHYDYSQNQKADYLYLKNTDGTWQETHDVPMDYGLLDEAWDVITITQGPGYEGVLSAYDTCLEGLIDYLNAKKLNPDAQIAFHMTWAYPQKSTYNRFTVYGNSRSEMFQQITQTAQILLASHKIDFILPTGTAVENARSLFGEIFTKEDGYHLNTVGDYVANYMFFASLTGKPLPELKYKVNYITDESRVKIAKAVNAALNDPFAYTDLS